MGCDFCPLKHKTDWYYYSENFLRQTNIIACRDLNDRHYKYRILIVPVIHRSASEMGEIFTNALVRVGKAIAMAHIANGWAEEIAHIDMEHLKFPEHYHIQICMR